MTGRLMRNVVGQRKIHLVTCQFAFHYSFESEKQAHFAVKSIAEVLEEGGMFIGTTTNDCRILCLLRGGNGRWTSSKFSCELHCDKDSELLDESKAPPMFGANYKFTLGEQVKDCTEYLINFDVLRELGERYGLKLIEHRNFDEFFREYAVNQPHSQHAQLLKKMTALSPYPNPDNVSASSDDFNAAKRAYAMHKKPIGSLSNEESEVAQLYRTFVFVKKRTKQ